MLLTSMIRMGVDVSGGCGGDGGDGDGSHSDSNNLTVLHHCGSRLMPTAPVHSLVDPSTIS